MDVKKAIAELTSQLSEVNYDSEEDNILLNDSHLDLVDDDYKTDDNSKSKLRKATETLALPENIYGGKKTSRKKLDSASEGSESERASEEDGDDFDDGEEEEIQDEEEEEAGENSEYEEADRSEKESDSGSNEDNGDNITLPKKVQLKVAPERDCNIYSAASKNVPNDAKKGVAIRNQLSICESLLKCRIKLQKALSASNTIPGNEELSKVNKEELKQCKNKVLHLLGKLSEVQVELLKQSAEYISKGKDVTSQADDEIPSDESDIENGEDNEDDEKDEQPRKRRKLNDYASVLKSNYNNLIPYRNNAIQKWNEKTKVSTGKMANSNFSAFDQSTLKQIEQIMADKSRLIRRTQIRRNNLSKTKSDENNTQEVPLDPEIFDDTDFYHKLLRDYIEKKSVDASSSSNTERQLIELQKLRSKMKRNVDTKSTKGRKLRYVVLPKLVNFMAPRPYNTWNEQAETELYNSLFGKIKVS